MTRHEFDLMLQRYAQNKCSLEEKQYVESWFESLQRSNINDLGDAERTLFQTALWERVAQNTIRKHPVNYSGVYWRVGKVAASVTLLFACLLFIVDNNSTKEVLSVNRRVEPSVKMLHVSNTESVTQRIELIDGSTLFLEPGSEISYPEVFDATREVFLKGGAFFEVSRDATRPFLVYTNEITTKVLGTSFRVTAYEDQEQISVAVKTGRVAVLNQGENRNKRPLDVILTPNQEVVYYKTSTRALRKLVDKPEIVDNQIDLKMHYLNAPVQEIFEALEKSYGISISYDKDLLSDCTITTDLVEEGLFERLGLICYALEATYRIEETSVFIEAEGCR